MFEISWSVCKPYLLASYHVYILIGCWCAAFSFPPRSCLWMPLRISSWGLGGVLYLPYYRQSNKCRAPCWIMCFLKEESPGKFVIEDALSTVPTSNLLYAEFCSVCSHDVSAALFPGIRLNSNKTHSSSRYNTVLDFIKMIQHSFNNLF